MFELPTYSQYKAQVDLLVERGELSVEDGIILLCVFRNHLEGNSTHVNYLMSATGLDWKRINHRLNSLTMKGGIRKLDKSWYSL